MKRRVLVVVMSLVAACALVACSTGAGTTGDSHTSPSTAPGVGDTVSTTARGATLEVTLLDVVYPVKGSGPRTPAPEGWKYVAVKIEVVNIGGRVYYYTPLERYGLTDSKGKRYDAIGGGSRILHQGETSEERAEFIVPKGFDLAAFEYWNAEWAIGR